MKYGLYFSYPLYTVIVFVGIITENYLVLLAAAVIAFLGIKLPLHPLDYIYNRLAIMVGTTKIPARGTELQVNSIVAVLLNMVVIGLISSEVRINYGILAVIYVLCNMFFIFKFLIKD